MTPVIEVAITASGTFAYLRSINVTEKVDRCFPTEHMDIFYMDLTGKGSTISAARTDLRKRIAKEVKRLEGNDDRKPSQDRRLKFLKSVTV